MEFFVPLAPTPEDNEQHYQDLAKFASARPAPTDKRVSKIVWRHEGEEFVAEVGKGIKKTERLSTAEAPKVQAIFEGEPWLIVREGGRSQWANPALAGNSSVRSADYFDAPAPASKE